MTTAAPRGGDAGRRPVGLLLLSAVIGVVLVTASVTETGWLSRDLDLWALAVRMGLVLAAAVGGAVLAWALRDLMARPHPGPAVAGPPPVPGIRADAAPGTDEGLVRRVLDVRDLLENAALRDRLDEGLRSVGFEVLDPAPGEPFDPAAHTAVDTEAPGGAATPGTVAAVEQVGLRRGGTLVRRASVVVWGDSR